MDIISKAIEKQLHLYQDSEMEQQTWEAFDESTRGKKLFLFGIGEGLNYFLRNCCRHGQIAGVVDNNQSMQGLRLDTCCAEAWQTEYGDLLIESPNVLRNYEEQDIAVLITSINYYVPMVKQMKDMGIRHYYILLMLEADRRERLGEGETEDLNEIRSRYIEQCCQQRIEAKKIIMLIGVYGSHARQITNALLKKRSDLDIVWIVNDMHMQRPEGVRLIYEKNWNRYVFEMETAKIWVFDDIISPRIRKREGQIYIQVKHWSSITLKKFYLEDKSSPILTKAVEDAIKYDGARMDYLFSGSEFDEQSCRNGFMFKGKNIRVGSPRSDVLFDSFTKKKVFAKLELPENAKVCIYVPTFRIKEELKSHSMTIVLDMEALLKALSDKWEGEWFLLVRLHPSLVLGENVLPENAHILNAGSYPDSEELVAASDIMITDYSSIMFEQAYQNKPVFLYAPDRQEYIERERGLLIDYDMLPFPIAESNEELYGRITNFDVEKYKENLKLFFDKYGVHEDGHASERAADFMIGLLETERKCI